VEIGHDAGCHDESEIQSTDEAWVDIVQSSKAVLFLFIDVNKMHEWCCLIRLLNESRETHEL
jgi:hypothetical protein